MKSKSTIILAMLAMLFAFGCQPATNDQSQPIENDFTIVSPTRDALVNGEVTISVSGDKFEPILLEFYMNGEIFSSLKSSPWVTTWSTEGLTSNSQHTIKVIAYNSSRPFTVTKEISVRIK